MTPESVDELQYLYIYEGWHVSELAKKYHVHSSVISLYTKGLSREVEAKKAGIAIKSYDDYLYEDEERRAKIRQHCEHKHIAIICTKCGQHFEETKKQPAAAKITFL